MRILALAIPLALWGLAGCSTEPDTYASMTSSGVGFGDYQRYLRDRETSAASARSGTPYSVPPQSVANPRQAPILPPAAMPAAAPTTLDAVPLRPRPVAAAPMATQTIATQTLAPVGAPLAAPMSATPVTAAPVAVAPMTAAPVTATAAPRQGIHDAQTYHADSSTPPAQGSGPAPALIVAASIPAPSETGGANLMEYALATTQTPGTEVHRRINPMRWSTWQNNCLRFRNQDDAQRAFLDAGGPERDRENIDPDGDGFACWWDPTPLRQAVIASR